MIDIPCTFECVYIIKFEIAPSLIHLYKLSKNPSNFQKACNHADVSYVSNVLTTRIVVMINHTAHQTRLNLPPMLYTHVHETPLIIDSDSISIVHMLLLTAGLLKCNYL